MEEWGEKQANSDGTEGKNGALLREQSLAGLCLGDQIRINV